MFYLCPFGVFISEKASGFEAYVEGGLHVCYLAQYLGLT